LQETALDLFIDRKFMTSESWDKLSSEEAFRFRGLFRESEPGLAAVLEHARVPSYRTGFGSFRLLVLWRIAFLGMGLFQSRMAEFGHQAPSCLFANYHV
jgi:hypothetical protein